MNKKQPPKYASQSGGSSGIVIGLAVVMGFLIALAVLIRVLAGGGAENPVTELPQIAETEPAGPEHVVSEAEICVTGDILMHMKVVNSGLTESGGYNYDPHFRYLAPYVQKADWAVANLETTLAGTDAGYKYSGHPAFNSPDTIVDALKNAGFDLLLTANNHCYDTSEYGFLRTLRTVQGKGLEALGTRLDAFTPNYTVKEINGIRIGMVCYTYQGQPENPKAGVVYMNKNALSATCGSLINAFIPGQLESFYTEISQCMENMKRDGAEATMIYIHWGTEYLTTPTAEQRAIAQRLCDLGFDVIVGGHPHVIEPVELLSSQLNPEHRTVCLYSTGNTISNQRTAEMQTSCPTGHTEDGLLFSLRFVKYSDDTVYLDGAELLPCWVDMVGDGKEYNILPLDPNTADNWQSLYALSDEALENAKKSAERTKEITGSGMLTVQEYLDSRRAQRDADYLAAITPLADAA